MGFCPPSFIADADGEAATGRLGWTDKKRRFFLLRCTSKSLRVLMNLQKRVCVLVCVFVYLWSRRVVHLGFEDL